MELVQAAGGIGVFDDDLSRPSIEWDPHMRVIWGLGPDVPALRAHFYGSIHPDDLETVKSAFALACVPGGSGLYQAEFRIRRLDDGTERVIAASGLVKFAGVRPVRLVGSVRDVTEQRAETVARIEAARLAEEGAQLVKALLDAVPSPLFAKDREGRYLLANRETLAVIGLPWEQVQGRTDADWAPADQGALIRAVDLRVMEEGRTLESEEPYYHDEAGERLYLTRKTPLRDSLGAVIGVAGSAVEITHRVRAEREIRSSETQLRRVLDQLFSFVGVLTVDGRLLTANRAPLELAGVTLQDVQGLPFWEASWWSYSAEAQARVRASVEAAARGETVRFDVPVRFSGDRLLMTDFQIAPLRDDNGEIVQLIPSGFLIEDRVQAERARELLIGELNHRIKNLYAVANGILGRSARSADSIESLVATVSSRLSAMARAHDLVSPAAHDAPATLSLDALLQTVLEPHATSPRNLAREGKDVQVKPHAVTPLAMVLHEMATNAAKYGALRNPEGCVSLNWAVGGDGLTLDWRETGGPPVRGVGQQGFGSLLIRSAIGSQLGGEVQFEWPDTGCRAMFRIPADHICA
jgi:PAS domain S-box-containing protein